MPRRRTELVVLSGGLDSTTLTASLVARGRSLRAIYFDIGYLPRIPERNAAKMVAHAYDLPLEIVDVAGIFDMVSGFVPIRYLGLGELDKGQPGPKPSDIPDRYYERNYVVGFPVITSLASYYALLGGIGVVNVGLIKDQVLTNPGVAKFIAKWSATVAPLNPNRTMTLRAPLLSMTKVEVIRRGAKIGVDFANTWSCHRGGPLHCGECGGCVSRAQSFRVAKIRDATIYAVPPDRKSASR